MLVFNPFCQYYLIFVPSPRMPFLLFFLYSNLAQIPQAMRFVDLDAVKALLEGDIGEASAEALQSYGELQQVSDIESSTSFSVQAAFNAPIEPSFHVIRILLLDRFDDHSTQITISKLSIPYSRSRTTKLITQETKVPSFRTTMFVSSEQQKSVCLTPPFPESSFPEINLVMTYNLHFLLHMRSLTCRLGSLHFFRGCNGTVFHSRRMPNRSDSRFLRSMVERF